MSSNTPNLRVKAFRNLRPDQMKIKFIWVVILYLIIALIASIQCYYGKIIPTGQAGREYHNYNNYIIFKNSFFHLIRGENLYISFPDEQWDLYKYSPTFSLLFGLLAYLPDFIGLLFWNLLNTVPLLVGFTQLKGMSNQAKMYSLIFCSVELSGSLQTAQSNGLLAALLILTFTSLENGKYLLATLLIVFSMYIKIYGGIGVILFLFYPGKAKLFLFTLFWLLLLGLLPLLVINPNQLLNLYKSWDLLLSVDGRNSVGVSVMGILHTWFKFNISNAVASMAGIILICLPFLEIRKYKFYEFRLLVFCMILIWMVIFNYKAESATYIISICGIAIWFFSQPVSRLNLVLLILAFIFTTLSSGDLIPGFIKYGFIKPYHIKALFSIIIFGRIYYGLFNGKLSSALQLS
jgi:Glycosyltransferase family 87